MVQNCALTQLRDFDGKFECLFTIILVICVFRMRVRTEEAKQRYVEMLVSIFVSYWLGL